MMDVWLAGPQKIFNTWAYKRNPGIRSGKKWIKHVFGINEKLGKNIEGDNIQKFTIHKKMQVRHDK